jgi:hypothetical protein
MRGGYLLLLLLAWMVAGCSRKVSREECTTMLDKYVDMTMHGDDDVIHAEDRAKPAIVETKKAQKKADESYKKALGQCEAEVSKHELDCAMRAQSPEGWQACID